MTNATEIQSGEGKRKQLETNTCDLLIRAMHLTPSAHFILTTLLQPQICSGGETGVGWGGHTVGAWACLEPGLQEVRRVKELKEAT